MVDLSLSKVARGKVMAAKKAGEAIPEGWALDASGNPTTDPDTALAGTMIPAGDAKGAALALLVEILAATLTGSNHSTEATSFFDGEGAPPGVGQFVIAIDPARTAGDGLSARLEGLLRSITDQPGARLPGSSRLAKRAQDLIVPGHLLAEIRAIAQGS